MSNPLWENNEIIKSVKDNIEDKATSPVYGVFIISWLIFHWKFVYTAIFVSEEKIWMATGGTLKSDYLTQTFFNFSDISFYLLLALPFLFTWLFIWKFPKWISIPAFKKSQESDTEKLEIKLQNRISILRGRLKITEVIEEETKRKKEIKEQEKEIKEIDPMTEWLKEFEQVFLSAEDTEAIIVGSKAIYETGGKFVNMQTKTNPGYNTYISSTSLSRLDALGLIKIRSDRRDAMEFTEKGKFFIRELQKKGVL